MKDPASSDDMVPGGSIDSTLYKKDFWGAENLKYSQPHYRLEKSARIINRLAQGRRRTLLDVGCGPATSMPLLHPLYVQASMISGGVSDVTSRFSDSSRHLTVGITWSPTGKL
jgi:hypothetical protein